MLLFKRLLWCSFHKIRLCNSNKALAKSGNKVKVVLKYRGREMSHTQIGFELLKTMIADIGETGKVEAEPKMEGRQVMMVLGPIKA